MRFLATGLCSLLPALPLLAAEGEESVTKHLPVSPLGGGALLETLAGLLFVILLIFALGWLLRRFGRHTLAGKGDISVVAGVSLGPRERVVLLQVGDTRLLVGVAPGRVQTLHVLAPEEASEVPPAEAFSGTLEQVQEEKS